MVSNVAFFQTLASHLTTGFLSFLVSYIARGHLGAMAMDCGLMVWFASIVGNDLHIEGAFKPWTR